MPFEVTYEHLRAFVVFCAMLGEDASAIHSKLVRLMGDGAPKLNIVYRWISVARGGGRTTFEDAPRSGRPRLSPDIEGAIQAKLEEEPFSSVGSLAAVLWYPRETIRRTLTEKLNLHKYVRKWVPHTLTDAQKQRRVSDARTLLTTLEDKVGSRDTITGDESWYFFDNPGMGCGRPLQRKSFLASADRLAQRK